MAELLPGIVEGTAPGEVFDATTGPDGVAAGYHDIADRTSLKVLVRPRSEPPWCRADTVRRQISQ